MVPIISNFSTATHLLGRLVDGQQNAKYQWSSKLGQCFLSIGDNNSETNVSFKKARKNECNVIDDGVKIIFKLHLNFYATTILKLLGERLT